MSATRPLHSASGEAQPSAPSPRGGAAARRRRRIPLPLLALLAVAVVVRLALIALIPSGYLHNPDSVAFMGLPLFADARQPSGYHALLAGLRIVWSSSVLIVAVQHVLGVLTGVLAYATAREAGLGQGLAAAAAAPVLLAGEQLYLEHAVLSEALLAVLLAAGVWAAVRADARDAGGWAVAAGALLGLAAATRSIGIPVALLAIAWLLFAPRPSAASARRALAAAAGLVVVVGGYLALASTGTYSGLLDQGGAYTYGRAGEFADCRRFDPPPGTAGLCEARPPAERPGPRWYVWSPDSPATRLVAAGTRDEQLRKLAEFGRAAILGQPLDYGRAVLSDLARYIDTDAIARPDSGDGFAALRLSREDRGGDELVVDAAAARYPGVHASAMRARPALSLYGSVMRLGGALLVAALALLAVGALVPSAGRRVAVLCALVTLALTVIPVATLIYNQRYVVPAYAAIGVGAAIGAARLRSARA